MVGWYFDIKMVQDIVVCIMCIIDININVMDVCG